MRLLIKDTTCMYRGMRCICFAFLTLSAVGCQSVNILKNPIPDRRPIKAGDVCEILIVYSATIQDNGMVSVKGIPELMVAGLDFEQASEKLQQNAPKNYNKILLQHAENCCRRSSASCGVHK